MSESYAVGAAPVPAPGRMRRQHQPKAHACAPRLAPRCAALCKIAMGYMLIMLL
jgi:hypothetical protein